jgi:sigma-B regulation protein RsbU (phosphoserine phosphatase)|tara:strand:+ start:9100 stop:10329 length:1230 start_codon:yes stop_codon:yes gene_type:complete
MALSSSQKDKVPDTKFKLRRILEVTSAINENRPSLELFELFGEILASDLKIGKVVFLSQLKSEWKTAFEIGCSNFSFNEKTIDNLSQYKDIGNLSDSEDNRLSKFDTVIPVLHKRMALGFLLLKEDARESSKVSAVIKNLNYIQSTANIIMVAIENKRMAKAQLEQVGLKRELQLAEHIQKGLLPSILPNNNSISAVAIHQSYGEIGGDYYDLIQTSPEEYYFCIADISGKGISAALIMSNFQATFRATVNQALPLVKMLELLNKSVLESSRGDKFITFFVGKYDSRSKELEYVNCAHPSALLFNENRVYELKSYIPGLGMLNELPPFETQSITMTTNTILACYTDGISELENEKGEPFGVKRIKKSLRNFGKVELEGLVEHVTKDLKSFAENSKVTDDIAALNILFKV